MSWMRVRLSLGLFALSLIACSNIEAERRKARDQRDAAIRALPAGAAQWARSWDTYSLNGTEAGRKERVHLALTLVQSPALQQQLAGFASVDRVRKSVTPEILDTLGASADGETVLLAARWKAEVLADMGGALPLACKASELAPNLFLAQMLCGDGLESQRGDSRGAAKHWRAAYPLASSREEQCAVVERIAARSLDPDQDMKEMSATIVAKCQEEQRRLQEQEAREDDRALHEKVLQAMEGLRKQLEKAMQALPPQPANSVYPPSGN